MAEYYKSENGKRTLMALSKIKQDKQIKVDITDYQDIADCIRSDQVPANHIAEYFNDKKFYKWYKRNTYEKESIEEFLKEVVKYKN